MNDYRGQERELILAQSYSSRVAMAKAYGETITQLKADLAKFGGHTAECAVNTPLSGIQSRATLLDGNECDCGYEQAKERGGDGED